MRVLMTADTVGGVWTYAIDLCSALAARGVDITLIALGRPMSPDQRQAAAANPRLDIIEFECKLEWMQNPWDDVRRSSELLLDCALRVRPNVVHLSSFSHASLPWRALSVPVLLVGHSCVETWWRAVKGHSCGVEWQRYRETVRRGIHAADVFVAPTRSMLQGFAACYGPHRNGRVIHNGRDGSGHGPGEKQPIVLAAGRLWDEAKNIAALEEASRCIDWPVRLAGDGRAATVAAAGDRGVQPLGRLTPAELATEMSRASIYALPAKYEPFGLSAVEAAMCGCALVLGDIATLREVWGDTAVYADPDDPRAIADAVNDLIADAPRRSRLAAAARRRAQRYTPGRMAAQYLDVYRSMAQGRRTAARRIKEGVTA